MIAAAAVSAMVLTSPAHAVASPWSDHDVVAVRLVAGGAEGGTALVGLHFRLKPEWHVYWKHPGDAGAPPEVNFSFDGGARTSPLPAELAFPAPQRFHLPGGLEALGYEREVVYPVRADISSDARGTLRASVDYVACAVECIPFHDDLQLVLDGAGNGGADEQLLRQWLARVPRARAEIGLDARLRYRIAPATELELELAGAPLDGADPELFLEPAAGANFGAATRSAQANGVMFRAPVLPETAGRPPQTLRVAWTVTGLRAAGQTVAAAGQDDVPATSAPSSQKLRSDGVVTSLRQPKVIAALSLPALLLALFAWTKPSHAIGDNQGRPRFLAPFLALPDAALRILGFIAAAALVWTSYRLAPLLPTERLAGVQISWLTVGLAMHSAMRNSGFRRAVWWLLAVGAAAFGLWIA